MPIARNVNPVMIKWAREDAGFELEDLPKSLHDARWWESGEKNPTWADLRNLAKKYKRPAFFYFLPEPPKEEDNFLEFRSDEKIEKFSPQLRLEIRKAKYRRNAYIHIHEDMGINFPMFNQFVLPTTDEKKLANHIRNFLNVDFKTQKNWVYNDNGDKKYDHSTFLNHWKELCFDLGILVFEMENISESEVKGCSIYYDSCPIILLNGKNTPNRRIFTLLHELVHLTQGESAICDVNKYNFKETFFNKVATDILIPDETLDVNKLFYKNGNVKLGVASHIYGVSKQTMVYKLYSSKLIDNDLKEELISEIEKRNFLDKQKKMEKNKKSSPRIPTRIKKRKYDGEPYTRLIVQAYENRLITAPKAVRYLDTSIDKIEDIINDMWG